MFTGEFRKYQNILASNKLLHSLQVEKKKIKRDKLKPASKINKMQHEMNCIFPLIELMESFFRETNAQWKLNTRKSHREIFSLKQKKKKKSSPLLLVYGETKNIRNLMKQNQRKKKENI